MKARIFMLALAVAVFTWVSMATAETALKFNFRDVMAPGSIETDAYDVGNGNVVAGDYVDANNVQHAMLLKVKTGKVTTVDKASCLPDPGTTGIQFFGVNGNGDAVGWCTDTTGTQVAFKYIAGVLKNIKITGAQLVNANGINNHNNIVGTYVDASGLQHGFLLVGKKLTNLDPPGVVALATAFGINDNGVVTIYGQDANGTYVSFTTKDKGKTYKPFHAPGEGSVGTAIHHININGDIVGTYFDADSNRHGVLKHLKKFFSFDDPSGVNSTRGNGINDTLGISGRYSPSSGNPPEQGYFGQAR